MKTGRGITMALIRDAPEPYPMPSTGGHERGGKAQEDALRAPSKNLGHC
jgi:hypothetical protein